MRFPNARKLFKYTNFTKSSPPDSASDSPSSSASQSPNYCYGWFPHSNGITVLPGCYVDLTAGAVTEVTVEYVKVLGSEDENGSVGGGVKKFGDRRRNSTRKGGEKSHGKRGGSKSKVPQTSGARDNITVTSVTLDYTTISPSKSPSITGNLITEGVQREILNGNKFEPRDPFIECGDRVKCYVKSVTQLTQTGEVIQKHTPPPGDMHGTNGVPVGVSGTNNTVYVINSHTPGVKCEVYGDVGIVRVNEGSYSIADAWVKVEGFFDNVDNVYGYTNRKDRSGGGDGERMVLLKGSGINGRWSVVENGVVYKCGFIGGALSTGMFPDARGMRWWMANEVEGGGRDGKGKGKGKLKLLNLFAHGCGYSVAARSGGRFKGGTDVDLDKRWMELGEGGGEEWDMVYGDALEWVERFRKRRETWDVIIVDPPSSSVGKKGKRWSSLTQYPSLVTSLTSLLPTSGGTLITISNLRSQSPEQFYNAVLKGINEGGREGTLKGVVGEGEDGGGIGVKKFIWDVE
ncbi:hypothetical protein TrCOL_g3020 [Triparma columacea]|uniref:S-adenosylmethionine-dependent methyltransferase domain-containing protein n=1 Tax=Triparma columacea TaxID=722753 RepID=A0A9W7LCH1_9STRA|nr:hypothetical protein TrCOL_g3020 [Triparma columacea]